MPTQSTTSPPPAPAASPTLDDAELARFAALSAEWWDPKGKFRPLHQIGPVRLQFVRDRLVEHFAARGDTPAGDAGSLTGRPLPVDRLKPLAGLRKNSQTPVTWAFRDETAPDWRAVVEAAMPER